MKRDIAFGSVVCALLTVGLAAQSAPANTPQRQTDAKSATGTTITGCLQAADGSGKAVGASGSDASKADKFILANASGGGATGSPASATAAPGSASPAAGGSTQYALSGGKKEELRTMLNNKVEIVGKVERSAGAGTNTNGDTSQVGTTGSAMSTGSRAPETKTMGTTLRIDSIKTLAPNCN